MKITSKREQRQACLSLPSVSNLREAKNLIFLLLALSARVEARELAYPQPLQQLHRNMIAYILDGKTSPVSLPAGEQSGKSMEVVFTL